MMSLSLQNVRKVFLCYLSLLCFSDAWSKVERGKILEKEGVSKYEGFAVVGSRGSTRGGIISMAGKMNRELAALTGEKGREIKLPIIIQLYGKEGDEERKRSIVPELTKLQGKLSLKLHIHLAKGVDFKKLRYYLMKLLIYERSLSGDQVLEDGERVEVNPWLVIGVLEALDIKRGRSNRKIYQSGISYFKELTLQNVFDAKESEWKVMDGRKQLAFRAISGAMVNALLRQPGGRKGMLGYLSEVAAFRGEQENLMRKHFPGMNKSKNSLMKWVDLEMAELSVGKLTQIFSILETEKRLNSALKLRFRDEQGSLITEEIEEYEKILKLGPSERKLAVAGARSELERLSFRCFPDYRLLITKYDVLLQEIVLGKDRKFKNRLDILNKSRWALKKAGERARDYLDWYYITQSDDVSGDFRQYRELAEALKKETLKTRKNDVLQSYLDKVEALYEGER